MRGMVSRCGIITFEQNANLVFGESQSIWEMSKSPRGIWGDFDFDVLPSGTENGSCHSVQEHVAVAEQPVCGTEIETFGCPEMEAPLGRHKGLLGLFTCAPCTPTSGVMLRHSVWAHDGLAVPYTIILSCHVAWRHQGLGWLQGSEHSASAHDMISTMMTCLCLLNSFDIRFVSSCSFLFSLCPSHALSTQNLQTNDVHPVKGTPRLRPCM